jgi:TPP-dependent pyruvate/acetoin dehydrogenase alpha subunit
MAVATAAISNLRGARISPPPVDDASFFRTMLLIRRVEEKLLDLFAQGLVNGTTHTSLGQEAGAVGVLSALDLTRDVVFSNHRCHGHFLAYGAPLDLLFGEVMGKTLGACLGIGGSQHLHYRNFYSNGVQGGIVPAAAGMALAEKANRTGAVATVFLGDGTLGEGIVYEAFNMASLWHLPLLFVVDANGYAQSTPTSKALTGHIAARPRAFGIETVELTVEGPMQVFDAAAALIGNVRASSRPGCLVLNTYRLGPHSKGDDPRSTDELHAARARDPLERLMRRLPAALVDTTDAEVRTRIDQSLERCLAAAELSLDDFLGLANVA